MVINAYQRYFEAELVVLQHYCKTKLFCYVLIIKYL